MSQELGNSNGDNRPLNSYADQLEAAHRSLQVPRDDHAFLVSPSLADARKLFESNRNSLNRSTQLILDRPLCQSRELAQHQVAQFASVYTTRLTSNRRASQQGAPSGIVATGHQPELFHPGVWVKNATAKLLASRLNSTALNLIIDNDLFIAAEVAVPYRLTSKCDESGETPRPAYSTRPIVLKAHDQPIPWEEVPGCSVAEFSSFAESIEEALDGFGIVPLIAQFHSKPASEPVAQMLATQLTQFRHRIESEWRFKHPTDKKQCAGDDPKPRANSAPPADADFRECPMSWASKSIEYHRFVAAILGDVRRFFEVYNLALASFRLRNNVRGAAQPVPPLTCQDGWFETPFWVWSINDPTRRALFIKHIETAGQVVLSSGPQGQELGRITAPTPGAADEVIKQLTDFAKNGLKIRTRALTTTMFARLFLSDLFVHGIGGAKYDEMTDDIIKEFFGVDPPGFLTISYSAWLPFASALPCTQDDLSQLKHKMRDIHQNPQRYLEPGRSDLVDELIKEKERLIADQHSAKAAGSRQGGRKRYQRFPAINRFLARHLHREINEVTKQIERTRTDLETNRIIKSREFSYCLFPSTRIAEMIASLEDLS